MDGYPSAWHKALAEPKRMVRWHWWRGGSGIGWTLGDRSLLFPGLLGEKTQLDGVVQTLPSACLPFFTTYSPDYLMLSMMAVHYMPQFLYVQIKLVNVSGD